jgi:hypothetical protein
MATTFAGALLGLVPNTPETPLGYLLVLILTLFSVTPFLVLPLAGIGIGWVVASRWIERRLDRHRFDGHSVSGDIPGN